MNTENQTEADALSRECELAGKDIINAGEFIDTNAARRSLASYLAEPGVPGPYDKEHIYGHTFGLNKINALLARISKYNDDTAGQKIEGIRIYYGKCQRRHPDYSAKGELRDVFLMPVFGDGTDVDDQVSPFIQDGFIVGEGRPCPNQCGKKFNE